MKKYKIKQKKSIIAKQFCSCKRQKKKFKKDGDNRLYIPGQWVFVEVKGNRKKIKMRAFESDKPYTMRTEE